MDPTQASLRARAGTLAAVATVLLTPLVLSPSGSAASGGSPGAADACEGPTDICDMTYEQCLRTYSRSECDRFVPVFEIPTEQPRLVEAPRGGVDRGDGAPAGGGTGSRAAGAPAIDSSSDTAPGRAATADGRAAELHVAPTHSPAQVANVPLARTGLNALGVGLAASALLAAGVFVLAVRRPPGGAG